MKQLALTGLLQLGHPAEGAIANLVKYQKSELNAMADHNFRPNEWGFN